MRGDFFLPTHWSLFFGRKYREEIVQQPILFSSCPHLLHQDSQAPAALAADASYSFLSFPINPNSLSPLFKVCTQCRLFRPFSPIGPYTPPNVMSIVILFQCLRSEAKRDQAPAHICI